MTLIPKLRIEIDIEKIRENSLFLVSSLRKSGISVTGVTKGVSGNPRVARAMLNGGITCLADSRISNVLRMRKDGISCPIILLRQCPISEIKQAIKQCEASFISDLGSLVELSKTACEVERKHGIVLMVEVGDGRDGLLLHQLPDAISLIKSLPNIYLTGLAANFGCLVESLPKQIMFVRFERALSLAQNLLGIPIQIKSVGGSSAMGSLRSNDSITRGRNLRLGESILLGSEPSTGKPIDGLHQDIFSMYIEVIECSRAGESLLSPKSQHGKHSRLVLAAGNQDTDVGGLSSKLGIQIIGSTSDHMVVHSKESYQVGSELRFSLNYNALARAMCSPDVAVEFI